jgi:hypothetical protein
MQKTLNVRDGMSVREATQALRDLNVQDGERVNVKFRVKKRKKFKSFRVWASSGDCGCCGSYNTLKMANSQLLLYFDDHTGPSYITPQSLI